MSPQLRKFFQEIGKTGGQRAADNLTPEARKARAKKAADKRWAKVRATKKRRPQT